MDWDMNVLDWVDSSLESWESYETSNEDNTSQNYYADYDYVTNTENTVSGNSDVYVKTTDISADQNNYNYQNFANQITDDDQTYYYQDLSVTQIL